MGLNFSCLNLVILCQSRFCELLKVVQPTLRGLVTLPHIFQQWLSTYIVFYWRRQTSTIDRPHPHAAARI
jgi:hypothetical protein